MSVPVTITYCVTNHAKLSGLAQPFFTITSFVGLEHGQSAAEAALLSSITSGDSVEKTQMVAAGTARARGFTSETTLRAGA